MTAACGVPGARAAVPAGPRLVDHAGGAGGRGDRSTISRLAGGARAPTREGIAHVARGYRLDDGEHDELLSLAGFTPVDAAALVADEPVVAARYRTLHSTGLDDRRKADLRALVAAALTLAGDCCAALAVTGPVLPRDDPRVGRAVDDVGPLPAGDDRPEHRDRAADRTAEQVEAQHIGPGRRRGRARAIQGIR